MRKIYFCLAIVSVTFSTLSAQTPQLLKDIRSGTLSGFETASQYSYYNYPFSVVWQHGGNIFFTAVNYSTVPNGSSYTNDVELWKSDGTTAGTMMLKDIYPGNDGSYPQDFVDVNGTLYFTANNGTSGRELWKTDGTTGGTMMVKEIMAGSVGGFETASQYYYYDYTFSVVWQNGGIFYFLANDYATVPNGSSYTNDIELWQSDGTAAGTFKEKDIYPGNDGSYPQDFNAINGMLYFTANNGTSGRELWKTDGTTPGTVMVKEIMPGSVGGFETASQYYYYDYTFSVVWQNGPVFYFLANDYATVPNGSSYTNDIELWQSDGTAAGTFKEKDIYPGNDGSYPQDFNAINGMLYFTANNGTSGRELWKTDGTTPGTVMVKEIMPGSVGGFETASQYYYYDYTFSVVWQNGGIFYFLANDYATVPNGSSYTNDIELWQSDGTAAGTFKEKDIYPGNDGSYPQDFNAINGMLYFTANNGTSGRELWKTDGTTPGTVMVKEIMPGSVGGFETASQYYYYDYTFSVVWQNGPVFYFLANDYATVPNGSSYTNDIELWQSDGTAAGTFKEKDIYPGNDGSYPQDFNAINGMLYFTANNGTSGRELWKTDGTTPGTVMVKEIMPGSVGGFETASQYYYYAYPFNIPFTMGGTFYFVANDYASVPNGSSYSNNLELWRSNGTNVGTSKVMDIYASTTIGSYPADFAIALNKVFFTAEDATHGRELWTIDLNTGIHDLSSESEWKIFPNPASDKIYLVNTSRDQLKSPVAISITDLTGKSLYSEVVSSSELISANEIDIRHLSPGAYLLEVKGNHTHVIKKIIKQ